MNFLYPFFRYLLPAFLFFGAVSCAHTAGIPEIQTLKMTPAPGMTRADLKFREPPKNCRGALVLCPGFNRDGEYLLRDAGWRDFAEKHNLAMIALCFASEEDDLSEKTRRGYYYVSGGSGELLLEGIGKIVGRELPIAIFGWSGGAHFTHRFVYAFPEKISVWCAYGFGWFDEAPSIRNAQSDPPGIFVCGTKDERYEAVREAFLSARRAKRRVCRLSVAGTGHAVDHRATERVRKYFDAVLSPAETGTGVWAETKCLEEEGFLVKSWFPSDALMQEAEALAGITSTPGKL